MQISSKDGITKRCTASVKVLDIDIDMMTNDVFVQKMNEYLSDDKLDVILFASTELLDKAMGRSRIVK